MHVSDALISPPVALSAGIISFALIGLAAKKIKDNDKPDIIPLMGVMGAFVFAAQMINFTIPGTGSSGHLIGGILLASVLGPWCAFITLASILIVQCLFFADGGLLALGCNILNMGATSCLLAFPFIYKPIVGSDFKTWRIMVASIAASVFALELGAFAVTVETEISQVTALPISLFLKFMLPIHLAIGLIEGIVTGSLIIFIAKNSPQTLLTHNFTSQEDKKQYKSGSKKAIWIFGLLTLFFAGAFSVLASEYPDGLEWSIEKVSGITEFEETVPATALMPDYESGFAGLVGVVIVLGIIWVFSSLIFARIKKAKIKNESSESGPDL